MTDEDTPGPDVSAGGPIDTPFGGPTDSAPIPTDSAPIPGEGTTMVQKGADPIAGETTQDILGTGGVIGDQTRQVREAEVPGERTVDLPLSEGD
jgi:hypothetical protein